MGSPSLFGDKTCKHGVEPPWVPAIERIQDAQICWQNGGFDVEGPQGCTVGFHGKGTKLNAASYCETLERLGVTSRRQRPGLLTTGVLLLHDNVGIPRPTSTT